jgi:hypothetical protein
VEFLRKPAQQYAGIISDADLDICVKNFEQNHVAGSTILNFSDAQWNALFLLWDLEIMSDSNCRRKKGSVNKKCERQYGIRVERDSRRAGQAHSEGYAIQTHHSCIFSTEAREACH